MGKNGGMYSRLTCSICKIKFSMIIKVLKALEWHFLREPLCGIDDLKNK